MQFTKQTTNYVTLSRDRIEAICCICCAVSPRKSLHGTLSHRTVLVNGPRDVWNWSSRIVYDFNLIKVHKVYLWTSYLRNTYWSFHIIQMCSEITHGRVLNGDLYAQRFQKSTYLHLFTDCKVSWRDFSSIVGTNTVLYLWVLCSEISDNHFGHFKGLKRKEWFSGSGCDECPHWTIHLTHHAIFCQNARH